MASGFGRTGRGMTATKGTRKMGGSKEESRFQGSTTIESVLDACKKDIPTCDSLAISRMFRHGWVDTIRDLRLLHKEGILVEIRDLNTDIAAWLTRECDKHFSDDTLADNIKRFKPVGPMDTNGIIYYIATQGGQTKWTNPGDIGLIRVKFSSIMADSTPPTAILGRDVVRCVTKPVPHSFFVVDFTPRKINPTHYTLRHYSSWDTEALRSWNLMASNDGRAWTLIRKHTADASLDKVGKAVTWELPSIGFFSKWKIEQTAANSNGHHYLACSGLEFYGDLEEPEVGDVSMESMTLNYSYDMDTNGLMYWLGCNRGSERYTNPALRGFVRVVCSSLAPDSKPTECMVGRDTVRCVTAPKKSSWVMFDLLSIEIIPTHYTLRHYSTFDTECLRNWTFDASENSTNGMDGTWVTLIRHSEDSGLFGKGSTHTWKIPPAVVAGRKFSKFRLWQYGLNSNSHHYLACSGFELYGTIVSGMSAPIGGASSKAAVAGPKRIFKPTEEMDTNGLLYFLGTGGYQKPWMNPAEGKIVEVKASSLMTDSVALTAVCGRSSVRCVTKPQQRSWIYINLKEVKIKLTHYMIRHYSSWDTEALRYWNLEASNDGVVWTTLKQHYDDRSLRRAGAAHVWEVATSDYYQFFRIFMTGRNSNNHWYLSCSGIEFYGEATGGLVSRFSTAKAPDKRAAALSMGSPMRPPPLPAGARAASMAGGRGGKAAAGGRLPGFPPGTTFDYASDLDNNGICYWLGTMCGTKAYANPMSIGMMKVLSCGLMHDSSALQTAVGRDLVRCVTKPVKMAWFVFDFGEYAIMPSHYTLRHYSSWDTEALRNWRFEGSCNGVKWELIREHKNDTSLNFKGQTFTWPVRAARYYTMFRLLQFDKNSNGHYYLSLSGFEIYGAVARMHRQLTWDSWPGSKSKCLTVDNTTNSVINTGSKDGWQTCKTREPLVYNSDGRCEFSVLVYRTEKTSNAWKFMAGIAPSTFSCTGVKQWLGAQSSWAYIAGTGGICFDKAKSLPYSAQWGEHGDLVTVVSNTRTKTIEFVLNGQPLGVAFKNFDPSTPMHAAVSLTATNSALRLMQRVTPKSGPPKKVVLRSGVAPSSGVRSPVMAAPTSSRVSVAGGGSGPIYGWDTGTMSPYLAVFPDGVSVTNRGSKDAWQGIVSKAVMKSGKHTFEIEIINDTSTTNSWKFIIGVVPLTFDPRKQAWLGSQESWGYIAGNGGKCHRVGKPITYGKKYGGKDKVRCTCDFSKKTIEFFLNGRSQGVAFKSLVGPVRPAVSLCAKGACLKITSFS